MSETTSRDGRAEVFHGGLGPNESLIGRPGSADRLTTPALTVNREALFANLRALQNLAESSGMRLWPHAKTHKSSKLALLQIEHGAEGIAVANIHEAESLATAGVEKILITSPVVGTAKISRLANLKKMIKELNVVVDCRPNLVDIAEAAAAANVKIGIVIDIDVGMGRTGITQIDLVVALAHAISSSNFLHFRGVQAYSGAVQHIIPYDERKQLYFQHLDRLEQHLQLLKKFGYQVEMVTGGGTGTLGLDIERGIFTDHQAGSYVFMDVQYQSVEIFESQNSQRFQSSLSLLGSVVSASTPGRATIDSGFKSLSTDGPAPEVIESYLSPCSFEFFGDEHGRLLFDASTPLPVGSTIGLRPPHCDPTVNLHDYLHVVSGNLLCDIWRIDARGSL